MARPFFRNAVLLAALAQAFGPTPVLAYDFTQGSLAPTVGSAPINHQRLSAGGTYRDKDGVTKQGTTNWTRNSTMQGAVVGVIGAGGAWPTNWNFTGGGLTAEILSLGIEENIDYMIVRFSGTATAGSAGLRPDGSPGYIVAQAGQTWTGSLYCQYVAGALPSGGLRGVGVAIAAMTTAGATTNAPGYANFNDLILSGGKFSSCRMYQTVAITDPATERVRHQLYIAMSTGSTYDFTLKIGLPQNEMSAQMTPPVKTYGAANSAPRIDYDASGNAAYLLEEQRTNLVYPTVFVDKLVSTNVTQGNVQFNGTCTCKAGYLAPDGTATAALITNATLANNSNGQPNLRILTPYASIGTYTISFKAMPDPATNTPVDLWIRFTSDDTGGVKVGTANTPGKYQYFTRTVTVTGMNNIIITTNGPAFVLAELQIEAGAIATSHIPVLPTFTGRPSVKWAFDSSRSLIQFAAGVPAYAFDPVSGLSMGLLLEAQSTNYVRNSTMVGAAVGTPGSIPANWIIYSLSGLTRETTSVGVENGIEYFDLHLFGTANATASVSLAYEPATGIAASSGQSWANSIFARFINGSASTQLQIVERDTTGAFLTSSQVGIAPTNAALNTQRFSLVRALNNASTVYVEGKIVFLVTNGQAYDFTIRVGLPQMEQGSNATSPIKTTNAAVTRAADTSTSAATTRAADIAQVRDEKQLWTYPTQLDNSIWNKNASTISTSSVLGPDGTSMFKLIEDSTNTSHTLSRPYAATAGVPLTQGYIVKAGERSRAVIVLGPSGSFGGAQQRAYFDLSTGQLTSVTGGMVSGNITALGNGLYWITITSTPTATGNISVALYIADNANALSYQGDGTSGIYVWAAKLETGTVATPIINGPFVGFNHLEGTIFIEAEAAVGASYSTTLFNIGDGSSSGIGHSMVVNDSSNDTFGFNIFNNANAWQGPSPQTQVVAGLGLPLKAAMAYRADDTGVAYNGNNTTIDNSVILPTGLTALSFGARNGGSNRIPVLRLKRFAYYGTRTANDPLWRLTA